MFPAEKPEAQGEYRNAQTVDHGIAERAYRETDSHKRQSVVSSKLKMPVHARQKRGMLPPSETCQADHNAPPFSNITKRLSGRGT